MQYEVDRPYDGAGEPSLTEMTEKAIKMLQKNSKGYFLFVEGGRIGQNLNLLVFTTEHAEKKVNSKTYLNFLNLNVVYFTL